MRHTDPDTNEAIYDLASEDEWRRALDAVRRAELLPVWNSHIPAALCDELDVIFDLLYRVEQRLESRVTSGKADTKEYV